MFWTFFYLRTLQEETNGCTEAPDFIFFRPFFQKVFSLEVTEGQRRSQLPFRLLFSSKLLNHKLFSSSTQQNQINGTWPKKLSLATHLRSRLYLRPNSLSAASILLLFSVSSIYSN